jgi:low temperature requirement protein LtrA
MLVAMAAMFVAALAVPDVFGRHGVVFGVALLIVNVMHLTLYALAARGDSDLFAAILRIALHAYEIIWWREAHARTRALRLPASASETGGQA